MATRNYKITTTLSDGKQIDSGTFSVTDGVDGKGFNWSGTWISGSDHYVDDVVLSPSTGNQYICIADVNPSNTDPASDASHWQLFLQKGAKGDTGAAGASGSVIAKSVLNFNELDFDQAAFIHEQLATPNAIDLRAWTEEAVTIGNVGIYQMSVPLTTTRSTMDNIDYIQMTGSFLAYDVVSPVTIGCYLFLWMAANGTKGARVTFKENEANGSWSTRNLNLLDLKLTVSTNESD